MGKLLKAISQESTTLGRKSILAITLLSMKPEDKEDLTAALNDLSISAASIARALQKNGYPLVRAAHITAYRRGEYINDIG
jgi:hypothetical protein